MLSFDMKFLVWLCVFMFVSASTSGNEIPQSEHLPGGDFELGVVDMEIARIPRYLDDLNVVPDSPRSDGENPIDGKYSLRLSGLPAGGAYRLVPKALRLVVGKRYEFTARVRSQGVAKISIQVSSKGKRIYDDNFSLISGDDTLKTIFTASGEMSSGKVAIYVLYIWVTTSSNIWLDDISVKGALAETHLSPNVRLWLEPAQYPAVLTVGDKGSFISHFVGYAGEKLTYRILDGLSEQIIDQGYFQANGPGGEGKHIIPVFTARRGYYVVQARLNSRQNSEGAWVSRSYVVLEKNNRKKNDVFFGLAMEEHGRRTMIDASITPDYLYGLASRLGAGSVRLFSLAAPDMLSMDGKHYDFHDLDAALDLADRYRLEPLLILGSNVPDRIPTWLRTTETGLDNNIDLFAGIRTKRLSRALGKTDGGRYLNVAAYGDYLDKVFGHTNGRVKYYAIWNEPGHKFSLDDYLKLAKMTRTAQRLRNPEAQLVGFSSTTISHYDDGKGKDASSLPSFVDGIVSRGGLEYIDILSYHSAHAYGFMGPGFDRRDQETGFVSRLRRVLGEKKVSIPIWDTERGLPWSSRHKSRADIREGTPLLNEGIGDQSVKETARQLPMIYAAAKAKGVERVFWFYFDASNPPIIRPDQQYGFFDAQLEPMPHLPVYQAMTNMLSDADFAQSHDDNNANRSYIFQRKNEVVIVAYNWKQLDSKISIVSPLETRIQLFDIMANPIQKNTRPAKRHEVLVGEWPVYIVLKDQTATNIVVQ